MPAADTLKDTKGRSFNLSQDSPYKLKKVFIAALQSRSMQVAAQRKFGPTTEVWLEPVLAELRWKKGGGEVGGGAERKHAKSVEESRRWEKRMVGWRPTDQEEMLAHRRRVEEEIVQQRLEL